MPNSYETANCSCCNCGYSFRVMADECGTHPCPNCGFGDQDESEECECENCDCEKEES